jgi:hypothetical protein
MIISYTLITLAFIFKLYIQEKNYSYINLLNIKKKTLKKLQPKNNIKKIKKKNFTKKHQLKTLQKKHLKNLKKIFFIFIIYFLNLF